MTDRRWYTALAVLVALELIRRALVHWAEAEQKLMDEAEMRHWG